ncbi:MAG: protein kinase [Planctomycetes bacterium]|nr:protein kinase [Planctomycetota bacterium]
MDAQDRALALLACQRGLVTPAALRAVLARPTRERMPQLLVRERVPTHLVTALVRELTLARFRCEACARECAFEHLAGRERLLCPCGGPLAVAPRGHGSSSFARPSAERPPSSPRGLQSDVDDLDRYVSEDLVEDDGGAPPPRPSSSSWGSAAPASSGGRIFDTHQGSAGPEGRRLGAYTIERELGRGSNGVVYLARRPGLERPVALKVLKASELADDEAIKRFQLEAAVAQKLRDPGIIAVHDAGQEGDTRYFVMEYCPGETLKERLQKGAMTPAEAAALVLALARTMAVAHEAGVIHRDLKPANIIIDGSGRPRVTDFGLARDRSLLESMTRTGDVIGTPFYMAPEQLRGEKQLDHRIDIYALGVVLYECLTRERPYRAETFVELVEMVTQAASPPRPSGVVPDVPRGLDAVVQKAMARDPRARYGTCRELALDLERVAEGKRPRAPLPRGGERGPARRQVAAAAALLLLAGGLGAALLLAPVGRDPPPPPAPPPVVLAPEKDQRTLRRELEEALRAGTPAQVRAALARLLPTAPEGELRRRIELEARRAEVRELLVGLRDLPAHEAAAMIATARARAGEDGPLVREVELALGRDRLRRGRYEDARDALQAAREDDGPVGREARRLLGFALEKLSQAEDARAAYASADGDLVAAAAAKRLRGDLPGAEVDVSGALERDPEHLPALLELARVRIERGDLVGADDPIERARLVDRDAPELLVLFALLKVREGKVGSAEPAIERALALTADPPDPDALVLRAQVALAARRLDAAQADLAAALRRAPDHQEGFVVRGGVHHARGDAAAAAADWRRAHALGERRCERLGKLLGQREAEFRRVLGLGDGPTGALTLTDAEWSEAMAFTQELFGALFGGGRSRGDALFPEALPPPLRDALVARAAAVDAGARDDLAAALVAAAEGRPWSDVERPLVRAVAFAGGSGPALLERARLLVGRDRATRAALEEARAAGASSRELDRLLAEGAWRAGLHGQALEGLDALAAADPDGVEGRCGAALALLLRGELEAAGEAAARALEVDPGHAPSLLTRAAALQGRGAWKEAGQALEAVYARQGALDSRTAALSLLQVARGDRGGLARVADHPALRAFDRPFTLVHAAEGLLAGAPDRPALEAARQLLDRARRQDPERPGTHLVLARHALVAGRPREEVVAAWTRARELSPGEPLPPADARRFRERFGEEPALPGR